MLREPNPYRPGFNQPPLVFAGRGDVLDGATEALAVAAFDGRTPRPLILVGPRGVGKTVTLGEVAELAATRHSWPTVHVEAKPGGGLQRELATRLEQVGRLLDGQAVEPGPRRRTRVTGGKVEVKPFGVGGELQLETEESGRGPTSQRLAEVLAAAMRVATDREAGLLLTLDELQNATPDELHVLGGILQEHVPDGWPLVVAIAALPALRSNRGPRRLPTYLERAEWHTLGMLAADEALEALTGPAEHAGRPMTPRAAQTLVSLAGGYPYALQVAGHFAWRASTGSATITVAHALSAAPRVEADLEQLFSGRWDDASPREREYLLALARVSRRVPSPNGGDVAGELGVPATSLSYLRDRLIKKGTLYAGGDGGLLFITPGMGAWVFAHGRDDLGAR